MADRALGPSIATLFSTDVLLAIGGVLAVTLFILGLKRADTRNSAPAAPVPDGFLSRAGFIAGPGLAAAIGLALTWKVRSALVKYPSAPVVIAIAEAIIVSLAGGDLGARAARVAAAVLADGRTSESLDLSDEGEPNSGNRNLRMGTNDPLQ